MSDRPQPTTVKLGESGLELSIRTEGTRLFRRTPEGLEETGRGCIWSIELTGDWPRGVSSTEAEAHAAATTALQEMVAGVRRPTEDERADLLLAAGIVYASRTREMPPEQIGSIDGVARTLRRLAGEATP